MSFNYTEAEEVNFGEFIRKLIGAGSDDKIYTLANYLAGKVAVVAVCTIPGVESVTVYQYDFNNRPRHEAIVSFFHLGTREEEIEDFEKLAGKPLRDLSGLEIYKMLKDNLVND